MAGRLTKNTVFHILALGVLLGVASVIALGPLSTGDQGARVLITSGDVLQLKAGFVRTWQREPTRMELSSALDKHIREEVLYREALVRGFDRDDGTVRRAMQRKMEFLAESQALRKPPTDEQIQAYFSLRKERYRVSAKITFAQVYVSEDVRRERAEQDALTILDKLRRADPETVDLQQWGDRLMLPTSLTGQDEQEIRAQFGEDFALSVGGLDVGEWQGPIRSGYGLHLVRVFDRVDSSIPEWTDVAYRIVADMEYEARTAAREQLYQEIAQNYQIVVDREVNNLLEAAGG